MWITKWPIYIYKDDILNRYVTPEHYKWDLTHVRRRKRHTNQSLIMNSYFILPSTAWWIAVAESAKWSVRVFVRQFPLIACRRKIRQLQPIMPSSLKLKFSIMPPLHGTSMDVLCNGNMECDGLFDFNGYSRLWGAIATLMNVSTSITLSAYLHVTYQWHPSASNLSITHLSTCNRSITHPFTCNLSITHLFAWS